MPFKIGNLKSKENMKSTIFKTRSENDTRLESLSDGVFALAIAITLLSSSSPSNYDELLNFVADIVPFGLSILFIFMIWIRQKEYFNHYGLYDKRSRNLNLLLLFFVLFYTYPLKFLMSWIIKFFTIAFSGGLRERYQELNSIVPFEKISQLMIVYGIGFICVFGCLYFLYRHAENQSQQLKLSEREVLETTFAKNDFSAVIIVGMISLIIAVVGEIMGWYLASLFSGLTYNLIWILSIFRRKKRKKILAELEKIEE